MIDEEKGLPQSRGGTEARRSKRSLEGDYTIWVILTKPFLLFPLSVSLRLCGNLLPFYLPGGVSSPRVSFISWMIVPSSPIRRNSTVGSARVASIVNSPKAYLPAMP